MNMIIDIETGGWLDCPFQFDESSVALGNLKDPEKIEAKLAEAKGKWEENMALAAETGEVLAVGITEGYKDTILVGREKDILVAAWGHISQQLTAQRYVVGHNLYCFDLPFMIRRSWVNGVKVPLEVIRHTGRYPTWHSCIKDTMLLWAMGDRTFISLDKLCKVLGVGAKAENFSGAMFAEYWRSGDQAKKDLAIDYLKQDLRLTQAVSEVLI
jgi:hypothetical protein